MARPALSRAALSRVVLVVLVAMTAVGLLVLPASARPAPASPPTPSARSASPGVAGTPLGRFGEATRPRHSRATVLTLDARSDRHGGVVHLLDGIVPAPAPRPPSPGAGAVAPRSGSPYVTRPTWRATGRAPPGPADR